jgi:hypothetical protein
VYVLGVAIKNLTWPALLIMNHDFKSGSDSVFGSATPGPSEWQNRNGQFLQKSMKINGLKQVLCLPNGVKCITNGQSYKLMGRGQGSDSAVPYWNAKKCVLLLCGLHIAVAPGIALRIFHQLRSIALPILLPSSRSGHVCGYKNWHQSAPPENNSANVRDNARYRSSHCVHAAISLHR